MAKGNNDSSLDDIDSILASLEGDDDFGLDGNSKPKNKREAVEQVVKDSATGFIDHFKSEPVDKIKKFVENAVPRGIQKEMGFVSSTINEVKNVYQEDAKELRSNSKELIDIVKSKMPDNSAVKKILGKISSKLGIDDDSPNYRGPTQDEMITETLDNLFKQKDARESTREAISEIKENHKFEHESKLSGRIIANLELKNDFDRNYTLNYYRKSIELKMKTMLITKELLETTRVSQQGFKTQFEAIIKNTSLPDLIKLKNSEQTKEAFKQRFRENLTDMFFATATPLENMKNNIIKKSRETIGNISSSLSMGLMSANAGSGMVDMANSGMMNKSQMVGGQLGEWVSGFASEIANKKLEDNQTVRDKLRKIKLMFADPKEALFEMSSKEADKNTLLSRFKARLYKNIGKLGQTSENDKLRIREHAPDEATFFDYRTKNSIVKIIPMLLSKIYGEVRASRTGEDPSGVYYDYTTGKLEENNNIKARFKNNIKGGLAGVAGANLESIMNMLENEEDGKLDESTKNDFKSAILSHLVKDGTISPTGLEKEKFLKLLPEDKREEFRKRFEKVMDKSKVDIRIIDDIKDSLYNIKANTPYIDKLVEEMYKNGNIEEIVKMGILEYDDKEGIYTVNKDKYQELLDSSLREMKDYDSSSFKPNVNINTNDDTDTDSMGKIFKEAKDKAYNKVNEKYNIDKKLDAITEELDKLSKTYDVDGKIQAVKDFNVSDLKDPTKRKKLFKLARIKAKRSGRTLGNKVDELKENINIVADMTPEEIKDYLLSQQPTLEAWVENKIKNTKDVADDQIKKLRNSDSIKTSEDNINKFIKQHRLKGKFSLFRRKSINSLESLSEKYGIEEKAKLGYNNSKAYLEGVDNEYGVSDKILGSYKHSKDFIEEQLKKVNTQSDIKNQNRLLPNANNGDFSNYKFEDSIKYRKIRYTKIKDILSLEKVDADELHKLYKTSEEAISGVDFLTWAKNLRFKFVNGQFIKMPEDARFENLRSTVIDYMAKQAQGIFNKDKKDKFSGIKSIFGIEGGMTPLQILGKVLKKTRAWDRKIMFDIVPKAMGKVFKFPFKMIKGGAKALYNGVFSRNTMNFARVLAGLDPVYPDGKDGKLSKVKAGLDKTRDMDKKIVKGTPGFIIDMIKKVGLGGKKAKSGVGNAWRWFTGKQATETAKETKDKIFGDEDGDGDVDGSWRDQAQQAKDKKPKEDKPFNPAQSKEKNKDNGLFGMLAAGFGAITTVLGKVYKVLGAIPFIGKGIKFMGSTLVKGFKYLGKPLLGLLSKLGILGLGGAAVTGAVGVAEGVAATGVAGKVAGEVLDKMGDKVDIKDAKKVDGNKIMNTLKAFKDKIFAKLGPKASVRVLATLSAKIASRIVPVAGAALIAYDAIMVAKDMIQNGTSFQSAVSRQILGFDLFNDDEPILDEDGNPVKPDEISGEEFAKDSLIQEYLEKSKVNPEEANKFRQENGLSMEDIATGVSKKKQQDAYMNSTEFSDAYQKAMNTKNVLNKSGKTLAETYGSGMDMSTGTFNLSKSKESVGKMLDDVAKQTGVDANMLKTVAAIESGMNPMASAGTSSAKGLFQFIDSTWKSMLSKYGGKYGLDPNSSVLDPMANALMGAEYIKENKNVISSVKKDVNSTDLYMAHFLGAGGAKQFLKADPSTIGAALLPSAASANKTIFYKEGGVPRTVGEIYQFLQNLVAKRAKEYGFTAGVTAAPDGGATTPVTPLVPETTNGSGTPPSNVSTPSTTDSGTSVPTVNNVAKTPTTNDMTSGFVPTTKTVSSQPEVDFTKGSDILQKSLEVQQSMDSTLKNILTKISEINGNKTSTSDSNTTTDSSKEQTSLDNPEAVIDLTKKRFN